MTQLQRHTHPWFARIVLLSLLLMFFAIPHTLEDFALGEPAKAGVPIAALALVIALLVALQALGIYWLGQGQYRGAVVHLVIGLFWPVASGTAQLPTILSGAPYRFGAISLLYVGGMIVVGALVFGAALAALVGKKTVDA